MRGFEVLAVIVALFAMAALVRFSLADLEARVVKLEQASLDRTATVNSFILERDAERARP